jgi:hypothetical protein
MSRTLTLEADLNSANTRTNVSGQGSVSTPSRVTPNNAKVIKTILVSGAADAAAEGAANLLLRLGGNAIKNGEQTIICGGMSANTVQAGSDAPDVQVPLFRLFDADIEVAPSETIAVDAEIVGDDLGDANIVVTLIFG